MLKSFLAAVALISCCAAGSAFAQSSDYGDGTGSGEAPTLIMRGLLTNPLSSGVDGDGYGSTATPGDAGTAEVPPEVPYSVEGEEQLEPETN